MRGVENLAFWKVVLITVGILAVVIGWIQLAGLLGLKDAWIPLVAFTVWGASGMRMEDAPVMPCERVSFCLKPDGFFDASPCVDVPCGRAGCASKL